MSKTSFMCDEPNPTSRLYNGRKLTVWQCKVDISQIEGWVDNPRIDVEKRELLQIVENRGRSTSVFCNRSGS